MVTRALARRQAIGAALYLVASGASPRNSTAGDCRLLRYSFQVAARPPQAVPAGALEEPPQIAIWLERGDGTFVDTLMVTSAVALRGIGNRPGRSDLPSGPKFPYGRRPMALPVWAHARGHLYPLVVMEDGDEADLMGHEATSSPEPHFCRPMLPSEIVDAVTCASGNFRSAKGVFATDGSTSYYPPRGDLLQVLGQPCPPLVNRPGGSCDTGDSTQFGVVNDLDTIAAATPPPDRPYNATWAIPDRLPGGDYAVMVEVSKEFDPNGSYSFPASEGPTDRSTGLSYGLRGNLGQPSVVYRVPIALAVGAQAATITSVGHGDPWGDVGTLYPEDFTLSTNDPGSGEGRLAVVDGPTGPGRVHVEIDACPTPTCDGAAAPPPVAADVLSSDVTSTSAVVQIRQEVGGAGAATPPIVGYELRYRPLADYAVANPTELARWEPGPVVSPAPADAILRARLTDLAPGSGYVVAVRANGACGSSTPTLVRFFTPRVKYRRLSGCFIASAAFEHTKVDALRRGRDRAVAASGLAAAAAQIYYRASPPLAGVVRNSELARAVTRTFLGPIVDVARAVIDFPLDRHRSSEGNHTTPHLIDERPERAARISE